MGSTYYENARAKADYGRGLEPSAWVLGEDSGIEVDGLGGRPGIESARFAAGRPVERLLEELEGVDREGRRARYVCELVALGPDGERRGTGVLEGRITREPRGTEGFGYDPIFVPAGHEATFGEMDPAQKHQMSHRADAFRKLVKALK